MGTKAVGRGASTSTTSGCRRDTCWREAGLLPGHAGLRLQPGADRPAVHRRPSRPSTRPGSTSPSARPSTGRSARTRASRSRWPKPKPCSTAARLLCYQTLWLKDAGLPHTAEAAMCKWWAPKTSYDVIHLPAAARPVRVPHREADRATPAGRPRPADRRRHRADHEADHRAREGRPGRRCSTRRA